MSIRQRQLEPEQYTDELRSAFELLIDGEHIGTVKQAGTAFFQEIRKLMPHNHSVEVSREAIFIARELCPVDDPMLAQERDCHVRREISAAHLAELPAARRKKIKDDARERWKK